jgi:diguanylate cyclase (GGDEF)-like protein
MIPCRGVQIRAPHDDDVLMDVGAIKAAAAASAASYRSFADATRSVLDLLERLMPGCALYLSHLDRAHSVHRIVDTRGGDALGLRSNIATPLAESYDLAMAEERAPRLCNDISSDPVYAVIGMQRRAGAGSYLGVALELSDGSRVGALAALSEQAARFRVDDEELFAMLARVLAYELERESNERDLKRLNDSLRDHARGMGAVGRVVRVLAGGEDGRRAVCRAACEMAGAPVSFLLEPSGREFVSTAMSGVDMAPVTILPRPETTGRAFTARESYFVADARAHPALAQPLVEATSARSALFEPVLRDGQVCGVLIVIWQLPIASVPEGAQGMLRLLAAQAAVAIEHAGLRARMETLTLTDELTGVATRRVFEDELPRELARARRGEHPVTVAMLDIDHLGAFNMLRGEREGDRLIKEAAARWRNELREVDVLARLEGGTFGVVLPNCGLGEAIEVLDRVRAATPRDQTASAGVGRWDGEEPSELLQARCDDALTAAKHAGRNLTMAAD